MPVYLETNALRKLTNYTCKESVYTSVFSIFELLSGITEEDFYLRKACLKRIKDQKIEVRGPMIDKLTGKLLGDNECKSCAYKMIMDTYLSVLKSENYSCFNNIKLCVQDNKKQRKVHARTWLKNWDDRISETNGKIDVLFKEENKEYMKQIYDEKGVIGLSEYFWNKIYNDRVDEGRLSHAEGFVGPECVENLRKQASEPFSKYNFKLFIEAQYAIFAKAYFINGNTQNHNNASDLLHLLYLNENVKFVSNDKIYRTISEACPEFKLIVLDKEKNLSELI